MAQGLGGAGAVPVRCRAEDQQREHKSAKIPPGSLGAEGSGCTGVHWHVLVCTGPLWAPPFLCPVGEIPAAPSQSRGGLPRVSERRWDPQGKHGAAQGSLHRSGSPSAASPSHVVWWETAERTGSRAGAPQLSEKHGTAGALQRSCSFVRLRFQFRFFCPPTLSPSPPSAAGVSKSLLPQSVPAAGARGQGSGDVLQPKEPGCPADRAKKLSGPPSPICFWSSL